MQIRTIGTLTPESILNINNPKDITAKRLLTLFVSEHSPLLDLLSNSPASKALNAITDTWASEGRDSHIYHTAACFLAEICDCFLEFVSQCPHVHITID